jgi:hypothetical protein
MIIYHDLKVISIRVPGTGSTAFHEQMNKKYDDETIHVAKDNSARKLNNIYMYEHFTAEQAQLCIDSQIWNSYEKISFVRHPYWWARSIYRKLDCFNMLGIDVEGSFEWYLKKLDKTPYFWFTNASGCVILDTIYRTEDLNKVYEKYNIDYRHSNRSPTKREYEITANVAPLLHAKFVREYEHYDKKDTFGQEWEGLNSIPSTARR